MTKDLYTTKDVSEVREILKKEQKNKCAVTKVDIPKKQHVLDHSHDKDQFVRAVLHRQVNAFIGKLENGFVRLIAWWYPKSLPTLLRECAYYLENNSETRWRHTGWIKKINTEFNKLNAKQQDFVLKSLTDDVCKNSSERKALFKKLVLSKKLNYKKLSNLIVSSTK